MSLQIKIFNYLKKYALIERGVNRFLLAKITIIFFLTIALKTTPLQAQIEGDIFGQQSGNLAGVSSLMSAVSNNDIDGVKFFSRAGGFVINQKNIGGATALHIAARNGNDEIIKILLDNGADVNIADNEGWTPLMRAAISANTKIVAALCDKSADASAVNNENNSVLIHATLADCSDCLNVVFTKSNLIKIMDNKLLKEQLIDSFIIARNRDNQVTQKLLEGYLDYIAKAAPLVVKPVNSFAANNFVANGDTKIIGGEVIENNGVNGVKYKLKSSEEGGTNKTFVPTTSFAPTTSEEFSEKEDGSKILNNSDAVNNADKLLTMSDADAISQILTLESEESEQNSNSTNVATVNGNGATASKFKFISGHPSAQEIILPIENNLMHNKEDKQSRYKLIVGPEKMAKPQLLNR